MNNQTMKKLTGLAAAVALLTSAGLQAQQAPYYGPAYGQGYGYAQPNPGYANPYQGYGYPQAYGNPYGAPAYGAPYAGNPYRYAPRNRNSRFGGMPWRGNRKGFGNGMPFESNFTPWSRRFWDEIGDGGQNPFRDMEDWIDPSEPREGAAEFWDDMLNAPHEMGNMPGGWTAPSVSVPNPVDVQREFENTAKDMPDEMRTQMDNINIQTW